MRALRQPERRPAVWPEWFSERSRFPFAVFTTRMCTLIIPNRYRSKPNFPSLHDLADRETGRPIRADIRQSKTDFRGVYSGTAAPLSTNRAEMLVVCCGIPRNASL